jgi:prepilin signal peptidase PulO-like enzyme (type II secretory pathway)
LLSVVVVYRYGAPVDLWMALTGNTYSSTLSFDGMRYQVIGQVITGLWILYTGMVLTLIDIDHQILPDVITLPGTLVGICLGSLNPAVGFFGSLIGITVGAGGIYLIAKAYELIRHREGMGFGDVKYLGFIGAVVGWQGVVWVIAIASLVGAVLGIGVIFFRKKSLTFALPFGPFLAFAALLMTLWGEEIRLFVYPPM